MRYRGGDEPSRLDLIAMKSVDLKKRHTSYMRPFGRCDHVLTEVEIKDGIDRNLGETYKGNEELWKGKFLLNSRDILHI